MLKYKHFQLIDYFKIFVKELDASKLEANKLLDFYDNINLATGEIKTINKKGQKITPYKNAFYKSLEFKIYETNLITVSGSLHKYYNNGAHNYNDFNYVAFKQVLKDLEDKFNIDLRKCVLRCLEVGVNIHPPIPTDLILENCFIHKTKNFEFYKNSDEGKYKQAEHTQYIIKLYNKALHYKSKGFVINNEILRFEIKYTKMQRVQNLGLYTLEDISNKGFDKFRRELLNEWGNVLFFDHTIKTKSKRIHNYKNPNYWSNLIQNRSKSNFYKHKSILYELTLKNSNNIHKKVAEKIEQKINELNVRGVSFYPLTIRSIHTPLQQQQNRICLVTGINISMQKDDSILLSHTGLKYYYQTDRKVYEQIKRKYLSKKWFNTGLKNEIKEIAHNIRNHKSNNDRKQLKLYRPGQKRLFDLAI